jgi:hypothetical protein
MLNSCIPTMRLRDTGPLDIGDLMTGLVRGLPAAQRRLDLDYLGRLLAFAPLSGEAHSAGATALANAILPSAMAIGNIEATVALAAEASTSSEFRVDFRLLNAGYLRRYQYTKTSRHELRVTVERSSLPPGHSLPGSP